MKKIILNLLIISILLLSTVNIVQASSDIKVLDIMNSFFSKPFNFLSSMFENKITGKVTASTIPYIQPTRSALCGSNLFPYSSGQCKSYTGLRSDCERQGGTLAGSQGASGKYTCARLGYDTCVTGYGHYTCFGTSFEQVGCCYSNANYACCKNQISQPTITPTTTIGTPVTPITPTIGTPITPTTTTTPTTPTNWITAPPTTCTPSEIIGSSCSDGIDNDCDGLIDKNDPDCTSCTPKFIKVAGQPFEINICNSGTGNHGTALSTCANLGIGCKLPTINQLKTLYDNKDTIGGFTTGSYWSSTTYPNNRAYYIAFSNGFKNHMSRLSTFPNIRCIRSIQSTITPTPTTSTPLPIITAPITNITPTTITPTSTPTNVSTPMIPPCIDTDKGKNIYIKGTTTTSTGRNTDTCMVKGTTSRLSRFFSRSKTTSTVPKASCEGTNCYIQEYYCEGSELIPCPDGCSNGACIRTTQTPITGLTNTTCIDRDNDGVCDSEDLCLNSKIETAKEGLRPNHYADIDGDKIFETNTGSVSEPIIVDSKITLKDTFGCNCEQILDCKSGDNTGEYNWGCTGGPEENPKSRGTINLWVNKQAWAAQCTIPEPIPAPAPKPSFFSRFFGLFRR